MYNVFKAENYIEPGLSLGIFKSECTTVEPTHTHDFAEIIYIAEGEASETVGEAEYRVRRGDLIFINYGGTHRFAPRDRFVYYNICFLPEVISDRIINRRNAFDLLSLTAIDELRGESAAGVIHFSGEERRRLEALLSDMLDEYGARHAERGAVLESYMTVIITKILRKLHPVSQKSAEADGVWHELIAYIDENLGEKLTLDALAKKCFYNPSYFSRSFKERFGTTLVDYIARARCEEAARLLRQSNSTVEEIAAACGFSDKSALYRAFFKYFGTTPGDYRDNG